MPTITFFTAHKIKVVCVSQLSNYKLLFFYSSGALGSSFFAIIFPSYALFYIAQLVFLLPCFKDGYNCLMIMRSFVK